MINDLTDFEEAMFENDFENDDISEPKKPRMPRIPENLTMLSAMNWLYKASKDSQLSDKFLKKAEKATSFIQDRMDITPAQATLLSIIVGESTLAGSCRNQNISRHLNCDAYQTLGLMNDLKALNVAHLTHMANEMNCIRYKPVKTVYNSIRDNKAIEKRQLDNLSFDDFFTELRHIIKMASDSPGVVETENLMEEISDLMKRNRQLCFCRKFNDYVPNDMTLRLTFIYYCSHLVNWGRDEMVLRHTSLDNLLDDFSYTKLEKSLANGTCALIANGLMECSCEDGMCGNAYRITDKARTNLLPEYKSTGKVSKNILMPEDITPKQLFFNVEDQKQIDTLYSLLSQENFDSVTGRLEQTGMRKGICILLSGTAGTGKTESVLQIARKTGRPLMQVQVSDIKDKYVGESEKKLAAMFDNYRNSIKEGQKTGILFLNECDQLLSKRLENISASVDQMSNAIQNILLEQMERFEGIMICTTNLVQNLDTAFERRFLYKIELGRPCQEARESIWKSMIPDITDFNATYLAQHYDLSGGQIENIARKSIIEIALNGQESLTLEKYCDYCERERFNLPSASKYRIGF